MKLSKKYFLETKLLSYSTIGIIILVILSVWFSGTGSHRSLFQNSIISTSILGISFFLFISFGLYQGVKLKDNIGSIVNKEKLKKYSKNTPEIDNMGTSFPDFGNGGGCGEIILAIILWILVSIVIVFLLYFLGIFFWAVILLFAAMLYWIFFRALRLVFKNSRHCKGQLFRSLTFGFLYSFLYISWIYGIIFLVDYLR